MVEVRDSESIVPGAASHLCLAFYTETAVVCWTFRWPTFVVAPDDESTDLCRILMNV